MKVRCIDNTHQEAQLTLGKKYEVVQVGKLGDAYYLKADDGRMWWMHVERFIVIEEEWLYETV